MTARERRPYRPKDGAAASQPKLTDTIPPADDRPPRPAEAQASAEYLAHFRARVLQDALTEATADYWRRRAAAFEAARPRDGDFTGEATPEQLLDRDARLVAIVRACHSRAALARTGATP